MKVIDLLNKIANGEEVPEKIKDRYYVYCYDKKSKDYKAEVEYTHYLISCKYHSDDFLNEEIEIIEDTPKANKLINPIEVFTDDNGFSYYLYNAYGTKCSLSTNDKVIVDKINEIIDKVNKL